MTISFLQTLPRLALISPRYLGFCRENLTIGCCILAPTVTMLSEVACVVFDARLACLLQSTTAQSRAEWLETNSSSSTSKTSAPVSTSPAHQPLGSSRAVSGEIPWTYRSFPRLSDTVCAPEMPDKNVQGLRCQICQKSFPRLFNLERHMMIHTGEKPFPCPICPHKSRQKADLQKHMIRHLGERT